MKPGLGARRCVRCGKKIEGEESRLLNACPFCGLPFGGTGAPTFTPPPGSFAPGPQSSQQQPTAYQQYQPPSPYGAPPYGAPPPAYGGGYQPPMRAKSGGGGALVWVIVITLLLVGTGVGIAVLLQLRSTKTSSVTPLAPFTADPVTTTTADDTVDATAADPTKPRIAKPTTTTPTTGIGTSRPFPSSPSSTSAFNNPPVIPVPSITTGIGANTPKTGTCKATLTLTLFNPSTRTCSFNTTANQSPGTLTFPCSGGGAASGTFGKQTFRGSISNGSFTLSNTDPFTFSGCNVESSQTIFGQISSGTGSYSYSERETGGSCSGVSTCRASARITSSPPVAVGGSSSGF